MSMRESIAAAVGAITGAPAGRLQRPTGPGHKTQRKPKTKAFQRTKRKTEHALAMKVKAKGVKRRRKNAKAAKAKG